MFLKPFSRKKETFWVAESRKTLSRKATRSWIYKMKSYNPLYIKAEFKLCSIKKSFGLWKLKSLDLILAPANYTKNCNNRTMVPWGSANAIKLSNTYVKNQKKGTVRIYIAQETLCGVIHLIAKISKHLNWIALFRHLMVFMPSSMEPWSWLPLCKKWVSTSWLTVP